MKSFISACMLALWVLFVGYNYHQKKAQVAQAPCGTDTTLGTISRVIDGDTYVLSNGQRVRVIGVNTPEIGEPGSREATEFVAHELASRANWPHHNVMLIKEKRDVDKYGRLLRHVVLLPDTLDIGIELVNRGLAEPIAIGPDTCRKRLYYRLKEEASRQ